MSDDREALPPADLKDRVIATLSERGLLRRTSGARRWIGLIAAAIVLFAAGLLAGHRSPTAGPVDTEPRFVLLLYEDSAYHRDMSQQAAMAEYAAWARSVRGNGQVIAGTPLDPRSWVLHPSGQDVDVQPRGVNAEAGTMSGFFIIEASSETEALAIARTCPHLRHGGRIAVRPVIPT